MKKSLTILFLLTFAGVLMNYSLASADAAKGQEIFNNVKVGNCKSCHDTGDKKKVGPGLKGVTDRQPKEWIEKWLADPQAVWDANDEHVQGLKKRMNKEGKPKTVHKPPVELIPEQITDLIDYLATIK